MVSGCSGKIIHKISSQMEKSVRYGTVCAWTDLLLTELWGIYINKGRAPATEHKYIEINDWIRIIRCFGSDSIDRLDFSVSRKNEIGGQLKLKIETINIQIEQKARIVVTFLLGSSNWNHKRCSNEKKNR